MKYLIIIFILAFAPSSFSQNTLTNKQWLEDLDFMVHHLDSIHPNLYTNVSKAQVQASINELKSKIPRLNNDEIIVEFLKFITAFKDGHTRLHGNNLTKKWYPLRIEHFSDGYYITAIDKEYSGYIGAKVHAINNHPVGDVFELIKGITPHDNSYSQEYFAPMYLTMSSIIAGLHIIKSPDEPLQIRISTSNAADKLLVLNPAAFNSNDDLSWFWKEYGIPANEYANILGDDSILPLYLKNYNQPFWYKYITENNAVYFAFNACTNDENNPFKIFNTKLWSCIDSVNAKYLIIDLRNNFGGTNSILLPLLHGIIKHSGINTRGHLFIITGNKTFSAAMQCATWIEFHCNPIFAGEPTGAAPNFYADPDFSVLPNSKLLLMISKYYWQNSLPWDNRGFIEPSLEKELSSTDYFSYKDPVIEEIFNFIKKK